MKAIIRKHPETNQVVTVGNYTDKDGNQDSYGKFRVEQIALEAGSGGVLNFKSRSAFITVFGEKNVNIAKAMFQDKMEYPQAGKIVRTESRTPIYDGHKPKVIPADPVKGTEEQEYLLDGAPVYFTDEWSDDANAQDTLISAAPVAAAVSEEEAI